MNAPPQQRNGGWLPKVCINYKSAGLEFFRWQVRSTTKAIQDRVLFPQRSLGIAKEMQSCFVSSGTSFIISFQLKIIVPLIRPLQDLHTQPVFVWRIFTTWQEKKRELQKLRRGFFGENGLKSPHSQEKDPEVVTFRC